MAFVILVLLISAVTIFLMWRRSQRQTNNIVDQLIQGSSTNRSYSEDQVERLEKAHESRNTYENSLALAEAYGALIIAQGDHHLIEKTIELYQQCVQEKNTPQLLFRLAWFQFLANTVRHEHCLLRG